MTARWTPFEIVTGAGAAFLAIAFACVFLEAGRIEAGLAARAVAALDGAGLYWFAVQPSGRRLLLTGGAADAEAAGEAAARAASVSGAGSIESRLVVIGKAGACQRQLAAARDERPVTFRKGFAEIAPASEPVLTALARAIKRCGARVEVAVHAEDGASAALALALSQRRADQVARRLAALGVSPEQVVATGYGVTQPVAGASGGAPRARQPVPEAGDAAGRSIEQRVEFRVLGAAT